jgi:hypothetical protein
MAVCPKGDSFPVPQVNTLTRACVDNIGFVQSQSLLWQLAASRELFFFNNEEFIRYTVMINVVTICLTK